MTNADDGKTETVKLGDVIQVALHAPQNYNPYQVAPPDAKILKPTVNPAALAVRGETLRAFIAVGQGSAAIRGTAQCGAPGCTEPTVTFQVTIHVGP